MNVRFRAPRNEQPSFWLFFGELIVHQYQRSKKKKWKILPFRSCTVNNDFNARCIYRELYIAIVFWMRLGLVSTRETHNAIFSFGGGSDPYIKFVYRRVTSSEFLDDFLFTPASIAHGFVLAYVCWWFFMQLGKTYEPKNKYSSC